MLVTLPNSRVFGRITASQIGPWIGAELLQAERDAVALAIELEHLDLELLTDADDLGRMLDALPRHVRDVQQAVDAAQVDERAVVGEVLDHALERGAFLEVLQQRLALGAVLGLDDRAARDDDVIALLIELDDLELERRAFEGRRVADRPHVDERARQERAHEIDVDGEAAANAAADRARDDLALLERLLEARPGARALGFLARQARLAEAVLDGVERHFDVVADFDFELAALVEKLIGWDDRLGLQPGVDDHHVGVHADDDAGENRTGLDLLIRETFF